MKGIIFHTRSFSVHDGPGIRRAIFLKGCPLQCMWCHNPESQSFDIEEMQAAQKLGDKSFCHTQTVGREVTVAEVMQGIRPDMPFFEESGGGVTLTGGEPLAQPDFAIELLKTCKAEGIHTALDTCGYAPVDVFRLSMLYTDLYLFDLKLADSKKHAEFTGRGNKLVLDNLSLISSAGKSIIVRIPLVEGITDTPSNLDGLKEIITTHSGIQRIDLLPYHTLAKHKFSQCNRSYALNEMENYSSHKAQAIADTFSGLATLVSVGG